MLAAQVPAARLTVPLDQRTIGTDHLAQSGDQPSCHLPARLARAFFLARAASPASPILAAERQPCVIIVAAAQLAAGRLCLEARQRCSQSCAPIDGADHSEQIVVTFQLWCSW